MWRTLPISGLWVPVICVCQYWFPASSSPSRCFKSILAVVGRIYFLFWLNFCVHRRICELHKLCLTDEGSVFTPQQSSRRVFLTYFVLKSACCAQSTLASVLHLMWDGWAINATSCCFVNKYFNFSLLKTISCDGVSAFRAPCCSRPISSAVLPKN